MARVANCMHCRFRLSVGFGKAFGIKGMDQAEFQDWLSAAGKMEIYNHPKGTLIGVQKRTREEPTSMEGHKVTQIRSSF